MIHKLLNYKINGRALPDRLFYIIAFLIIASTEKRPAPDTKSIMNSIRYISAVSFMAKASLPCITNTAIIIVNIIGIRHILKRAPIMTAMEQNNSANITRDSERVLPTPKGSGNEVINSSNAMVFSIPCLRNRRPNAIRNARINKEGKLSFGVPGKRNLNVLFIKNKCGVLMKNTTLATNVSAVAVI